MADIDASKASARKSVRVRIPLPAHSHIVCTARSWSATGIVSALCNNQGGYPQTTVDTALLLSRLDVLDRENAQICGVSIRALRHWRYGIRRDPLTARKGRSPSCPLCDGRPINERAYAYLLGLYLGDGHITGGRRGSYALSITCCDGWPGLIDAARSAMAVPMPTSSVFRVQRAGCTKVKILSHEHWPCLFPQHGPGRKHERRIELAPWQEQIIGSVSRPFCPGTVPFRRLPGDEPGRRPLAGGDRWSNTRGTSSPTNQRTSSDYVGTLSISSGSAGECSRRNALSVARREAVARLDEFVGPKY